MFIKKKSNKQIHGEVATANVSPPRGVFPKVEEDRAAVEKCADAASEQENLKLAEV